ncbi:MAG: helix-turn-helix domain-containing protein [Prolixibacteraceae bacterium]|nr:helix-turn-helix domain-containing protein [Prolixibacteraceae bacterium]
MIIGQKLRELREGKGLLLRQVAAELEVDTAYISKMERGEKNIKKEYIILLAKLYDCDENELVAIWLADKIFDVVKDESMALNAIGIAQKHLKKLI